VVEDKLGGGFWFGLIYFSINNIIITIEKQNPGGHVTVRQLIDMDNKSDVGFIDWEFIHDMQGTAPEMITPEIIFLTREFLNKIPAQWSNIKAKLGNHVSPDRTIHCAISDIENLGDDFKIKGTLKSKDGTPLAFHKAVVYDKDRFEDDYLGAVITDKNGFFSLAFGKKTFSDSGLESEPDIYFKLFTWKESHFIKLTEIMPEVFEKTETAGKKVLIDFGVIIV